MPDSKAHPQSLLLEDASHQRAKEFTYYPDYFGWNILALPKTCT